MKRLLVLLLALGAILLFGANAFAQTATWTANTTWTAIDNTGKTTTGTFTSAEMATMKFYLRARRVGDANPRKYFGETGNGAVTWSGDLAEKFLASGLGSPVEGESWEVAVSQAFKGADGVERDSGEGAVTVYRFPFVPRTPGIPAGPTITE
jgi:hypothetical protein